MWMTTQLHVINYWMRSKLGTAPVLVHEAVRHSEAMSASCFDFWFTKVKTIITKVGFACVLDQPETREIGNDCVTLFCNSGPPICGMTLAEGMEVEISSSRISTLEPYLLQIKDSAMRSLCCHPLQIERGRYH